MRDASGHKRVTRDAVAPPLPVIVDSREQVPYLFKYYDAAVTVQGLPTGDYSLAGYEGRVAVERKELDDLVGCLTVGRERFEKELVGP